MPDDEVSPVSIGAPGSAPYQPDPLSVSSTTLANPLDLALDSSSPVTQAPTEVAVPASRPLGSRSAMPPVSASTVSVALTITTFSGLSSIPTFAPYLPPPTGKPARRSAPPPTKRHLNPRQTHDLLFAPACWDRFFVIPASAPYHDNTLLFQRCLMEKVGNVPFHSRSDKSRLVRVDSEEQSQALANLMDCHGNHFCAQPDPYLNLSIGTVSLSSMDCPVYDKQWSDCADDLLPVLEPYNAVRVQCYTLPPRGRRTRPVNIAKIFFRRHDLPDSINIGGTLQTVRPYIPNPRQCQRCWRFGHPEKHCRSHARCSQCGLPSHGRADCPAPTRTCANCSGPHNVFYRGCPTYKFEKEVATIRLRQGLTLREAKQVARRQGFTPAPHPARSSRDLIVLPFSAVSSQVSSSHISPPPIPLPVSVPSSSVPPPLSSTSSLPLSNAFSVLDSDTPTSSSVSFPTPLPQRPPPSFSSYTASPYPFFPFFSSRGSAV